jgi:hypothetical protein
MTCRRIIVIAPTSGAALSMGRMMMRRPGTNA